MAADSDDIAGRARAARGRGDQSRARRRAETHAVGALLWDQLGVAARRRGFAERRLLEAWPAIVGERIAGLARPVRVARGGGRRPGGVLHLRASIAASLEVQHLAREIVRRVNDHLGRRAVVAIRLQCGQVGRDDRRHCAAADDGAGRSDIHAEPPEGCADDALGRALGRLGAAMAARRTRERHR